MTEERLPQLVRDALRSPGRTFAVILDSMPQVVEALYAAAAVAYEVDMIKRVKHTSGSQRCEDHLPHLPSVAARSNARGSACSSRRSMAAIQVHCWSDDTRATQRRHSLGWMASRDRTHLRSRRRSCGSRLVSS